MIIKIVTALARGKVTLTGDSNRTHKSARPRINNQNSTKTTEGAGTECKTTSRHPEVGYPGHLAPRPDICALFYNPMRNLNSASRVMYHGVGIMSLLPPYKFNNKEQQ
jgi:hypothetical protein